MVVQTKAVLQGILKKPFVETRFIASLPKDVLQSLIELVSDM
ncbi:MAG: hypothetical protein ACYTXT_21335 [Nostoc sp.]